MASNIDATQPPASNPTTAGVRANMAAAKSEIEILQNKSPLFNNKAVWYKMYQHSGNSLVDALGNGPDIPLLAGNGSTPNLWVNRKWSTPPDDGTGVASSYARIIGNAYLASLFSLSDLDASNGLLLFAGDYYAIRSTPAPTQTLCQVGGGASPSSGNQSIAFSVHTASGKARLRLSDSGISQFYGVAESILSVTANARNALCGYVDLLNNTIGISLNGADFVVVAINPVAPEWDDAEMLEKGVILMAQNPTTVNAVPINYLGGGFLDLGARCSDLAVVRFNTHPGLDLIHQLNESFFDSQGAWPDLLLTGKW